MKIRRNISIKMELWKAALRKARDLEKSLSQVISEFLTKWLGW